MDPWIASNGCKKVRGRSRHHYLGFSYCLELRITNEMRGLSRASVQLVKVIMKMRADI